MIETCVSSRESVCVGAVPSHVEWECGEAVDWSPVAPSRKLEELLLLGLGQLPLHDLPQPLNNLVLLRVPVHVARVLLQLLEVQHLRAAYQQFQLLRLEELYYVLGHYLVKTLLKGLKLLLAMLVKDKVYQQVGVLVLVLLVHEGLCAVGDQLVHLRLPKQVHLYCEVLEKRLLQVRVLALQNEVDARCHLRIIFIQVLKCRLDA